MTEWQTDRMAGGGGSGALAWRKWLRVRRVSGDTPILLTCHLSATSDKMADFVVNRPPLHPHQKISTNSQPVPQSAVNSFV